MEDPQVHETQAPHYTCPACGHAVAAETGAALLQCTHCGEQFFIPSGDPDSEEEPAEDHAEAHRAKETELSELRIRQVTSLRRGLIRSQSWWIILAGACLVGAAQLVWMIITGVRHGLRLGPIGDGLAAVAAVMVLVHCVRRAIDVGNEIAAMKLPDPETPPDLSALSDGSQRFTGLDEMLIDAPQNDSGEGRDET